MKARTLAFWIFVVAAAFALWRSSTAHAQVPIYTKPPTNSISGGTITNPTITGGTIDNTVIGSTTPAAGTFTAVTGTSGAISGNLRVNPTGSAPSVSTSGVQIWSTGAGNNIINSIDSTQTGDNRIHELSYQSGTFLGRFINDAYGAVTTWLTVTGGQAAGITSVAFASPVTAISGTLTIRGVNAAAGGTLALNGGAGSSTTGGPVTITGGTATSGTGANITITAGSGAGGTNAGGNVNLVPGSAVSTGTPGEIQINSARGLFDTCWVQYPPYATNIPVTGTSYTFFLANRAYRVVAASIINSSTSTVPTVNVTKDTGTTAPGAGSSVLTGAMTFSATANTRVTGTPNATVATTNLAIGDRLATVWGGTIGAITGAIVCVTLVPI